MSKLFMDEDALSVLLGLAKASLRDKAVLHMALATGFRASDLLNLRRTDVVTFDQDSIVKTLKVKMIKTGRMVERAIPLQCRVALREYLNSRKDDNPYLFCSESNNCPSDHPMNRSSLHRMIKYYLGEMYSDEVLRGNACHVTRRSMAKLISDKAGRIEAATKFLRHTSIANTIAYLDEEYYNNKANELVGGMSWNQNIKNDGGC